MVEPTSHPFFVPDSGRQRLDVLGASLEILVPGVATGGAYSVVLVIWPAGAGPRLHVHRREDELFYVLEGSFAYWCGGNIFQGGQGSTMQLPRNIPHAFVNTSTATARQLAFFSPGGFEQMFVEVAARGFQLPRDRDAIGDLQKSRYELEVLGPNPLLQR